MKYNAYFNYVEPRWGEIDEIIEADSVEDAEEQALRYIEMAYPEATDIDIDIEEVIEGE